MSQSKYLWIGASCLAVGAALYYLSRDTEYVEFNPNKHTVEEMRKIIDEMFVEGATLYCQKLNIMRQMKNSGEFTDDTMDKMLKKQIQEMDESEIDIFKQFKVTEDVVNIMMEKFGNDPEIKEKHEMLQQIQETVFDKDDMRICHVPAKNLPKGLDQDKYILIYRKQQECIRHEIYKILQETGGKSNDPQMQQEQQQRFLAVMEKKPEFQKAAFKLYDVELAEGETRAIEFIMRQAYLDYYSLSLQKSNTSGIAYSKRLQVEQKEHNAQLEKLLSGTQDMSSVLGKDPLLTKGSIDDKVGGPPSGRYGMKQDSIFVEKKNDDTKKSISEQLKEKMRQQDDKASEDKKDEEKKDEAPKEEEKKDEVVAETPKEDKPEVAPEAVKEEKKDDAPVKAEDPPAVVEEEKKD